MSDPTERLAQAIRDVIEEAVQAAVTQSRSTSADASNQRSRTHGPQPGDPVGKETRRAYEEIFREPAPKTWTERRLLPVAEARQALGGISAATFYKLVQEGELRLVKIGRRSFVLMSTIEEFIERHRGL